MTYTAYSRNVSWFEVFEADSESFSILEIQDSEIEAVFAVRLSKLEDQTLLVAYSQTCQL